MRMTAHEIALVSMLIAALVIGAATKHYRHTHVVKPMFPPKAAKNARSTPPKANR